MVFAVVVFLFVNLSASWMDPYDLLDSEDLEIRSTSRPALSHRDGDESWVSYNKWQCFTASSLSLFYAIHDFSEYGGSPSERTPTFRFENDEEVIDFDFDNHGYFGGDSETIMSEWKDLLQRSPVVCIYAAYLQDIAPGHAYWIVDELKSVSGYWNGTVDEGADGESSGGP